MGKHFSRFDPTPSRSPEECERHYTQVHVHMAQELLRPMPSLLSYHTNRAVAQADVNGGWNQRPRAWRFVVLRFAPGETLAFSPEQNEMVAQDHVNCLYRLRSCDAEETVLFDRLGGQTALAKFMLEADRPASVDPEQAWGSFTELADRVLSAMDGAFGARALFLNRVLNEVECEPLDVEGQRPIGILDETTRVGYSRRTSTIAAGARRRWASWRATARWGACATSSTSTSCGSRSRRRSTSASSSGDDVSAVDRERHARDVGGLVGGQEHDRRGDLLRTAVAAERDLRLQLRDGVRGGARGHPGDHQSGADRIHADVVPPVRDGRPAGQPQNRGLAPLVGNRIPAARRGLRWMRR